MMVRADQNPSGTTDSHSEYIESVYQEMERSVGNNKRYKFAGDGERLDIRDEVSIVFEAENPYPFLKIAVVRQLLAP